MKWISSLLLIVLCHSSQATEMVGAISAGMEKLGAKTEAHGVNSLAVDPVLRIVTAPCYMMEADIAQVSANIRRAITETIALAQG